MTTGGIVTLVLLVVVAGALALLSRPHAASKVDFYLAGQRIGVATNACAICGDYFSAASFLGVAAAVYASGLDGVWYATGFAAGFVPVALFVAAPLRRFGEYSIPDFLGRRLSSPAVRLVALLVVQLVILSYLIPQAVGSGITWELLIGTGIGGLSPYSTGVIISTVIITVLVVLGGMRGTTWAQAVQFGFLLAALLWLTAAVTAAGFSYPAAVEEASAAPLQNPVMTDDGWTLRTERNQLDPDSPPRFSEAGARYGPVGQFALVVTLIMGTAGLPHVMNRYFTNPSGRAARMTTVWVLGLAGIFYALAVMLGVAARVLIPGAVEDHPWLEQLTVEGVLRVPEHALLVLGRLQGGGVGLGVVAAAALLAVLSTIAGLLMAAAASWAHDLYQRHLNPHATQRQAVFAGRCAVVVFAMASGAIAMRLEPEPLAGMFPSIVAMMVTAAFALAGSALTPVFVLSIWWRGMTAPGAVAGMLVGGVCAATMLVTGLVAGQATAGLHGILLTPTLVAAPLALLTAVAVSWRTVPPDALDSLWVKLHGTAADRHAERLAYLTIRGATATDDAPGPRRREAPGPRSEEP